PRRRALAGIALGDSRVDPAVNFVARPTDGARSELAGSSSIKPNRLREPWKKIGQTIRCVPARVQLARQQQRSYVQLDEFFERRCFFGSQRRVQFRLQRAGSAVNPFAGYWPL